MSEGNIVATYKFGNSTVNISDAALPKTAEENKQRWAEYYQVAWVAWKDIMSKNPVVQAYHNAQTQEERNAIIPKLHAAGFTVIQREA